MLKRCGVDSLEACKEIEELPRSLTKTQKRKEIYKIINKYAN